MCAVWQEHYPAERGVMNWLNPYSKRMKLSVTINRDPIKKIP